MSIRRGFKLLAKDRETGWRFTLILGFIYLAFLVWMHVHHEMWRDEIHAWTLARLAQGFGELVTGDRVYEGHPPLWFWYLRVWTWFIKDAAGIQMATIVAAVSAVVLLLRYAPFPRYLKVLLLCTYYLGYEHTVMSRNLVLGWTCVCLFCALYHPLRVRHLALGATLALLALTSFYGLTMCLGLIAWLILDQVRLRYAPAAGVTPKFISLTVSPRIFLLLGVAAAGVSFCILTVEPPDINPFSPMFLWDRIKLSEVPDLLYHFTAGVLPWRRFQMAEFWSTSFTFWDASSKWPPYVGGAILLAMLVALYPSWRLMLAYFGVTACIGFFQQVRFEGSPRHWAHYFVFFLVAAWLLRTTYPRRSHWLSTVLLVGLCLVQVEAFVIATVIDTRYVFSGGRETAAFIRRAGLQDLPMVAGPDYSAVTVAGYLRRPYYRPETEEFNQTVVYHNRRRDFRSEDLMARAVEVARDHKRPVLIVTSQGLPEPPPGFALTKLFESRRGTIDDETFTVWRFEAK